MINFTLSKTQQAARDYAHQVALEEMRPISLACERTEKIPESFFWNMQNRFWAGAAGQARQQGQAAGEEERQENVLSNRARADLVVTFATIDKSLGREGIRPFVVLKGTPGFTVGRIEEKMGLRASQTAELIFENCRIPKDNLLSGRERSEKSKKAGFKAAMGTLDATRPMVGALAVGIAHAAYETTSEWVCEELPKGFPPHKRREIEAELEELRQEIEMARFLVWRAAWMADRRIPN